MPTFKTKFTKEPTASIAIWFHLTEKECTVIQRMARARDNLSPNQLLKEIAEQAVHETIAANR
jgi:hypothetical protein